MSVQYSNSSIPEHATPTARKAASYIGGVRAWTTRHPVAAFLVLAFGVGYPVMAVPILAGHGLVPSWLSPQLPGMDTERVASALLVFLSLLPAALLVTWVAEGRAGVGRLLRRTLRWRIGSGWWILVLTGLPVLTLTLAVVFGDTFTGADIVPFVTAQVLGLLANLVLINLWEETAWAGLVQTRLEQKHGLVIAALLTAVPFALIHLPLQLIGEFTADSLATALIALLIVCALVRLLLGVVLRGTRDSILAAALMHTMFNRSNNEEGLVAGVLDGDGRKLAGLVAVVAMTAVIALIARRRLGRSERLVLDATAYPDSPEPSSRKTRS